jgi:uncharacterized membrane protein
MKKFSLSDGAALVVWLLPAIYLFFVYSMLPQAIPVHYDINGAVNGYASKSGFLVLQLIMLGTSAFVYLLLKFLPVIDPKKQVKFGEATFRKLAFGVVIFISALNIVITFAAVHHGFQINKLVFPLIGLLFAFLGNMMNSIKPNYFIGFRTPWALENEDNWRATNRLASKIWFAGGIIVTIAMLFLSPQAGAIVFTGCILIMVFVPLIYSYLYFRKNHFNQNS